MAALFDSVADTYDSAGVAWFTPIARRLVAALGVAPGERALDVGCGRGAALFALARAVGPGGRATGIDLSPRMVAATRADVRARGLRHVEVLHMDACAPKLPSHGFDVLSASFVLFFLPAPVAALRAWRGLLVPGGRLGLATFDESGAGWLEDVFRPHLPPPAFGGGGPYDTDEQVERLVRAGGFEDVRAESCPLEVTFTDAEQWHAWSWSHGQRAVWERVPIEEREAVRAAAAARLKDARGADGLIRLSQRIRFTFACAPLSVEQRAAAAPT